MLPIATPMRSCGSRSISEMNPLPTSPSRASPGSRTSVKNSSAVSDSGWPTLSRMRPRSKPGRRGVDQEQADAARPGVGTGAGGDHHHVGRAAVGDERLRAVEDPVVAVGRRAGLEVREVRTARRLGHADRGEHLAGAHARQPGLLLLVGAEIDDVGRDDVGVDAGARGVGRAELRQLLAEHGVEAVVGRAGATELLGNLQPQQAELAGLEPHLAVDAVLLGVPFLIGCEHPFDEALAALAEGFVVFVVDGPLHRISPLGAVENQAFLNGRRDQPAALVEGFRRAQGPPAGGEGRALGEEQPVVGPGRLMEPDRVIERQPVPLDVADIFLARSARRAARRRPRSASCRS